MPMKRIYILLTKTKSVPSRIIGLFTRAAYTHAAIAFEDEPEVFYSFSRLRERFPLPGGLTTESPDSGFSENTGNRSAGSSALRFRTEPPTGRRHECAA